MTEWFAIPSRNRLADLIQQVGQLLESRFFG